MWWYGRGNSGGSWLPEEKKANMWSGRVKSGGSCPPAFPRSFYPGGLLVPLSVNRGIKETQYFIAHLPHRFPQKNSTHSDKPLNTNKYI